MGVFRQNTKINFIQRP